MVAKVLQLNFDLTVPSAEYKQQVSELAQAFADVPGLQWKIWTLNSEAGQAGGFYLFEDEASRTAFLEGDLAAQVKAAPFLENLEVELFEVMPEVTAITRGPVGAIAKA